ncbi:MULTISPECIES: hypothetical protein [unclassified Nocardiopsis]|uniref:hypothetical protein n=1 Tax=unclassified Nocardiopsis TaxID=2649073 RepID=UPI00135829E7|nr:MULTISPECIES: hypothetical protein [unclassified Nocardiopsis]
MPRTDAPHRPTDPEETDTSVAEPAPSSAGAGASPVAEEDAPLSQEDALHALRREASSSRGHAESARMSALTDHLLERLQSESGGLRIGTLALFNDSVRFGGGFHAAGGSDGTPRHDADSRSADLLPEHVGAHVDNFVRPADFDHLLRILLKHRLVVLARPDGTGREAVAVNLLAEAVALLGGGDGRIIRLGERDRPRGTPWSPPGKGCGLLLPTPPDPDQTGYIDLAWVEEVGRALESANSYMVVVTSPPQGVLLNTAAHSEVVSPLKAAVDPVAIVHRWVLGEAPGPDRERQLDDRLREGGALELLALAPQPRTAVSVAAAIRDGQDLKALVRRLSDPSARVHEWFAHHRSPDEVSFALAAAVLHDARYLCVSDAAVDLHRLLAEERTAPAPLSFHETLHTAHPWIVLDESGDIRRGQPRVRFREPRMQQAVLAYAWNHLDGQRTSLVRWLRRLVIHRDVEVQARARVATAVMAAHDLEHALYRFLDGWAGDPSPHPRRAAATVLGVVSEDPELTDQVWDLLHTWADRPESAVERRMAATSALVAGGPPGRRDPDAALGVLLAALGEEESWDALGHVAEALASLVDHGRTPHVLEALLEWSRPEDLSPLVLKSLLAFCYVAGAATRPDTGGRPLGARRGSRPAPPPLLLEQADQHLAPLVELWKRALARKPVQEVALDVLRTWIGHAAATPRGRQSVQRVLEGVAAQGRRHRERLVYWLGQWAAARGETAAAAADLRRAL